MKRQYKFKRRQMLKLTGVATAGSVLAGCDFVANRSATENASLMYQVVRPTGDVVHPMITQAARLDTLDDKTICMVMNGSFKSYVTMPVIEDLLRKKYPSLKVIPAAEMPRAQKAPAAGTTDPETDAMIAALKQKGCQAIISGNGG